MDSEIQLQRPSSAVEELSMRQQSSLHNQEQWTQAADLTSDIADVGLQNPITFLIAMKLSSACFAFFVAGINDGSLGSLIPYMLSGYRIGTGSVSILYASAFAGWAVAALVGGYIRAYTGAGGALVSGAAVQLLAQILRVWVCYLFHPRWD